MAPLNRLLIKSGLQCMCERGLWVTVELINWKWCPAKLVEPVAAQPMISPILCSFPLILYLFTLLSSLPMSLCCVPSQHMCQYDMTHTTSLLKCVHTSCVIYQFKHAINWPRSLDCCLVIKIDFIGVLNILSNHWSQEIFYVNRRRFPDTLGHHASQHTVSHRHPHGWDGRVHTSPESVQRHMWKNHY